MALVSLSSPRPLISIAVLVTPSGLSHILSTLRQTLLAPTLSTALSLVESTADWLVAAIVNDYGACQAGCLMCCGLSWGILSLPCLHWLWSLQAYWLWQCCKVCCLLSHLLLGWYPCQKTGSPFVEISRQHAPFVLCHCCVLAVLKKRRSYTLSPQHCHIWYCQRTRSSLGLA